MDRYLPQPYRAPQPGCFGVLATNDLAGRVIRVFTRSRWNHALLCVEDGLMVQAQPGGVVIGPLDMSSDILWSQPPPPDKVEAICLAGRALVGRPYGWANDAAVGLQTLGLRLSPKMWTLLESMPDVECSMAAALAWEAAGIDLVPGKVAAATTPEDLGEVILGGKIPDLW